MTHAAHIAKPIEDEAFQLARHIFSTKAPGWAGHQQCADCDTALIDHLAQAIRSAVAAERMACAYLAESEPQVWERDVPDPRDRIADKIRSRGGAAAGSGRALRQTTAQLQAVPPGLVQRLFTHSHRPATGSEA